MPDLVRAGRLALFAILLVAACDAPTKPAPAPQPSSAAVASRTAEVPSTAPTFQPIELRQLRLCPGECAVTGAIRLNHPQWGVIWLLTVKTGGVEQKDPAESYQTRLVAVDSGREIRWKAKGGDWSVFQPAEPATDRTGHAFIRYNAGRDDGLIILAPVPTGFDDLGTLPKDELSGTRFDSSTLVDRDGDGIMEVDQSFNLCEPTCAEGTRSTTFFRWNGSNYVAK